MTITYKMQQFIDLINHLLHENQPIDQHQTNILNNIESYVDRNQQIPLIANLKNNLKEIYLNINKAKYSIQKY